MGDVSYAEVRPNYLRDHIGADLGVGLIALAAYLSSLGGAPKTAWEWFVVTIIGCATVAKALQSAHGAGVIAPPK